MSFRVPEGARNTWHPLLATTSADGRNGAFDLPSIEPGWRLAIIASDGTQDPPLPQWEHVSIHAWRDVGTKHGVQERCPTWREMCFVKGEFWDDEDVVIQYHPRKSEYVNCHPFTLHLWRPVNEVIPTPPSILVGIKISEIAEYREDADGKPYGKPVRK